MEWLERAPRMIASAAESRRLIVSGLHDAGCASVIATAMDVRLPKILSDQVRTM